MARAWRQSIMWLWTRYNNHATIYRENYRHYVRSIIPLPQVRATVSFSSRSSFDGYSGSFRRLKLERERERERDQWRSGAVIKIEPQEAVPKALDHSNQLASTNSSRLYLAFHHLKYGKRKRSATWHCKQQNPWWCVAWAATLSVLGEQGRNTTSKICDKWTFALPAILSFISDFFLPFLSCRATHEITTCPSHFSTFQVATTWG